MKRNEYTILKRQIPNVNLHSLTGQYWFDFTNVWVPWSGNTSMIPSVGTLVHDVRWYSDITYNLDDILFYSGKTYISLKDTNLNNIPSTVDSVYWSEVEQRAINSTKGKYYKWNGSSWILYTGPLGYDHVIPVALEVDADEMGVMSSFDGFIEQVEQIVNFSYKQSGSTITIYGTMNPDKLRNIVDQNFTVNWGDGTTGTLGVNSGVLYSNLPSVSHTYNTNGQYLITVTLQSPWSNQKIQKIVTTPQDITITNSLGTCTGFTVPSDGSYLNYLNDYEYTNHTGYTDFRYMSIGGSKIGELKKYGETTLSTSSYTTGSYSGSLYTGYTLPNDSGSLYYMDLADGYTMITGTTSAFTKEEVYNKVITRNEHFIGFIEDPSVYSDIFVERGRQGIMEVNLRLGEIDNMSELEVYGNGYFKVRKQ
jgi:hypothetical protein